MYTTGVSNDMSRVKKSNCENINSFEPEIGHFFWNSTWKNLTAGASTASLPNYRERYGGCRGGWQRRVFCAMDPGNRTKQWGSRDRISKKWILRWPNADWNFKVPLNIINNYNNWITPARLTLYLSVHCSELRVQCPVTWSRFASDRPKHSNYNNIKIFGLIIRHKIVAFDGKKYIFWNL